MSDQNTYTINLNDDLQWDWGNLAIDVMNQNYTSSSIGGITGGYSIGTATTPYVMNQSGKIDITGADADINMNGKSLRTWMEAVEQRLGILQPNTKLEAEWAELKALGDRYRELEQDIADKMKTWDILSKPE